jgi:hypothetical protein
MTNTDIEQSKTETDFEAVGLYPGATMQIHAIADKSTTHHWIKFIGFIKNDCILATLPSKYGNGTWIQKGEDFVVRGFNGRFAYAFTSQVIGECTTPFLYLYFSWPKSIESLTVRDSLRAEIALPVNVLRSDNSSVSTMLKDLSISGAMIDSPMELGKIGDRVKTELMVNLPGNTVKVSLPAIIRNIHHKDDGVGFKTGLQFIDISQNDLLVLNYFIDCATQEGFLIINDVH